MKKSRSKWAAFDFVSGSGVLLIDPGRTSCLRVTALSGSLPMKSPCARDTSVRYIFHGPLYLV